MHERYSYACLGLRHIQLCATSMVQGDTCSLPVRFRFRFAILRPIYSCLLHGTLGFWITKSKGKVCELRTWVHKHLKGLVLVVYIQNSLHCNKVVCMKHHFCLYNMYTQTVPNKTTQAGTHLQCYHRNRNIFLPYTQVVTHLLP